MLSSSEIQGNRKCRLRRKSGSWPETCLHLISIFTSRIRECQVWQQSPPESSELRIERLWKILPGLSTSAPGIPCLYPLPQAASCSLILTGVGSLCLICCLPLRLSQHPSPGAGHQHAAAAPVFGGHTCQCLGVSMCFLRGAQGPLWCQAPNWAPAGKAGKAALSLLCSLDSPRVFVIK